MRMRKILPRLFAVLACLAPGAASAVAFDLPDIPICLELAPGAIALDNRPVSLNVRIILDGTSRAQAETALTAAQAVYAPHGITLSASYDRASFASAEGEALIAEAKRHYGGKRPHGTHVVYVLTSKDLYAGDPANNSLVGQADCIGGVAYAENAFAVGEALADEAFVTLGTNLAGKILGHEVGHLAGGHHHYANCVEAVPGLGAPCTLMINVVDLAGLTFSTINGIVVRGHAQMLQSLPPARSPDGGGGGGGGALGLLDLAALLALGFMGAARRSGRSFTARHPLA